MRAERMIKEYPNLKRELSVLEFQLSRCEGIDYDTVISSLTFSKPEGERVQTSGVSDVTARAALAYRKVADRMSDEWLSYLAGQYGQIKEELDFLNMLYVDFPGNYRKLYGIWLWSVLLGKN